MVGRSRSYRLVSGKRGLWSAAPALAALLALVLQLFLQPAHQSAAHGVPAQAAQLTAILGDGVAICSQADKPASGPGAPYRSCDDTCPSCRFAGQDALSPPEPPKILEFVYTAPQSLGEWWVVAPPHGTPFLAASPRGPPARSVV